MTERERLIAGLPHVFYVFDQSAAYLSFLQLNHGATFRPLTQNFHRTVYNACIESALISFRALHDFFKPRRPGKGYVDDMVSADWGFVCTDGLFMDAKNAVSVNKYVAHLTWHRVDQGQASWEMRDLCADAVKRMVEFLKHLKSNFLQAGDSVTADVDRMIPMFESLSMHPNWQPHFNRAAP